MPPRNGRISLVFNDLIPKNGFIIPTFEKQLSLLLWPSFNSVVFEALPTTMA